MVWRLMQDSGTLLEGSCISDEKFKGVYYLEKCLYEPIPDDELEDWIEIKEEHYIELHGLEKLLFYSAYEVSIFNKKLRNARYLN